MKYLLLGAGLQGTAIAFDLLRHAAGTTELVVLDQDAAALELLAARWPDERLRTVAGDVTRTDTVAPLAAAADCVISAVNYWYNAELARTAVDGGAHFVDLGGNNDVVTQEFALDAAAREREVTIVPDCGLAPGLAAILGHHLATGLHSCESLRLRVGGLPQQPRPPLNYQLVFAVQGLINEYVEPAVVIRDGERRTVPGLSELESLTFPEPFGELEAFQTSGGTSTLPQTLAGRVRHLDYKTIRYPGHCEQMRLLMDLGLMDGDAVATGGGEVRPRDLLGQLLERHLPREGDDVVLVLIEAEGTLPPVGEAPARPVRRSLRIIDRNDSQHAISAMMRMTGYPAAIIARMLASGEIRAPGARPQELIVPADRMLAELRRRGVETTTWEGDPAVADG